MQDRAGNPDQECNTGDRAKKNIDYNVSMLDMGPGVFPARCSIAQKAE